MSSFKQLQKQAAALGLSGTDIVHYVTTQQAYEQEERAAMRQEQREREEAEQQAQAQREEAERRERLELAKLEAETE
ncbi:hypothetical protein E2C01_055818 [Portunus trituberculatus]|uniref:Uncharacterized protein n=1 Tax=Portunus trituberculatus TaxID=210409 RepID=A0A5B7GVS4_PORTR|nr:hypothetical protein [Portunus trituberculatus]